MDKEKRKKYIVDAFLDNLETAKEMPEVTSKLAPFVAACLTMDYIINVNNGNIDMISESLLRKMNMLKKLVEENQ